MHDYRLRFLLLPGSWRSRLAHCVAELGVRVYERVVFPTLRAELDRRSDRVVDDAVPAPLAAGSGSSTWRRSPPTSPSTR